MANIEAAAVSPALAGLSNPTAQGEASILSPKAQLFQEIRSLGFSEIPLIDIGLERNFSPQEKHTAAHELNHAWAALLLSGRNVIAEVSVHPDSVSLGRTTFIAGVLSLDNFLLTAAAGAVETPFGPASGFGHDLWQARLVKHFKGGDFYGSVWPEVSRVRGLLSSIPGPVKVKMAEIVAHMKVVKGTMLRAIYERAVLEVALASSGKLDLLKMALAPTRFDFRKIIETKPKPDHSRSRIEYLSGGYIRHAEVKGGVEKATIVCGACGAEFGVHAQECPANSARKNPFRMAGFSPVPKTVASRIDGAAMGGEGLSKDGLIFSL